MCIRDSFYIDQGANAHLRLVLMEVGRKLVEAGRLDRPDDVMFLRYNELRGLIGSAEASGQRRAMFSRTVGKMNSWLQTACQPNSR